jgi:hypothetical protein
LVAGGGIRRAVEALQAEEARRGRERERRLRRWEGKQRLLKKRKNTSGGPIWW